MPSEYNTSIGYSTIMRLEFPHIQSLARYTLQENMSSRILHSVHTVLHIYEGKKTMLILKRSLRQLRMLLFPFSILRQTDRIRKTENYYHQYAIGSL
jgi:hypothetical protein